MRLGVIVTSCNQPRMIALSLACLRRQSRAPDEVIVADDASDPEVAAFTRSVCERSGLPIRFLSLPVRTGSAGVVRNLGIRSAAAEYIVFLDGDVLPAPDCLARHAQAAAPHCFQIADRALLGRTATESLLVSQSDDAPDFETLWKSAERSHLHGVTKRHLWQQWRRRLGMASRHQPKILACHFSVWRVDLEAINGFDEEYVGWGNEDDDLSARLYLAGRRSGLLVNEARAVHLWHPSRAPAKGDPKPNRERLRRRHLEARCVSGLRDPSNVLR